MRLARAHLVAPIVVVLATVLSLAPHLLILGYRAVGATPPAAIALLCPLHHLASAHTTSTWHLQARPLT